MNYPDLYNEELAECINAIPKDRIAEYLKDAKRIEIPSNLTTNEEKEAYLDNYILEKYGFPTDENSHSK